MIAIRKIVVLYASHKGVPHVAAAWPVTLNPPRVPTQPARIPNRPPVAWSPPARRSENESLFRLASPYKQPSIMRVDPRQNFTDSPIVHARSAGSLLAPHDTAESICTASRSK